MSEDNVWLAGRRQEQDALGRIILKLEQTRLADGPHRPSALPELTPAPTRSPPPEQELTGMRGNPDNLR